MNDNTNNNEKCLTCKFFLKLLQAPPQVGGCRRFPPQVYVFPAKGLSGHPELQPMSDFATTLVTSWCGEWRPKISVVN